MISFVNHELVFAVHSIHPPWLNFQRLFLVLQWLSFRWRFMDQHWHSVFDDSIPQTWIYFCYRFYASLVNSLTLSTPYVSCQSYFCGDFKVYGDSVFVDDFWSVVTQFSLTIPCVNDDSVFSNDFIRQPWISIRCPFYPSAMTQFSKMISRSTVTQFFLTIYGSALASCVWRFHASKMNLFLLSVLCVAREFFDVVDSIRQLSVILQWRFQGQQSLCFRWRFLVGSDAVFTDDSMRQRWLCFLYWFHPSTAN
jgi:hypothetical protein